MNQTARSCIARIQELNFDHLPISEYNRRYIKKIFPHLEYYFSIYIQALSLFPEHEPKQTLIVDFGGGHGFLSFFLKTLGYQVVYCDLNPLSVNTVKQIKKELSEGPDYIVEGSTSELKHFCSKMGLKPDFLIATDLIEHIYDLSVFFGELKDLNSSLEMVFTTGTNPENSYKCWKLHRLMVEDEKEHFRLRREFVEKRYPEMTPETATVLARLCRGKTYADTEKAVELYHSDGTLPEELADKFNTCDPSYGNWTERILPFDEYTRMAKENGFRTSFFPWLYHEKRRNKLSVIIFRLLNRYIKRFPRAGWKIAPCMLIRLSPSNE